MHGALSGLASRKFVCMEKPKRTTGFSLERIEGLGLILLMKLGV